MAHFVPHLFPPPTSPPPLFSAVQREMFEEHPTVSNLEFVGVYESISVFVVLPPYLHELHTVQLLLVLEQQQEVLLHRKNLTQLNKICPSTFNIDSRNLSRQSDIRQKLTGANVTLNFTSVNIE